MYFNSTTRMLPPQRRMQSFKFVESFKYPWEKPGHERKLQTLQWDSGDWTVTTNGFVTVRQVRGTAQARMTGQMPGADMMQITSSMLVLPLLVDKLFRERNATTGKWHCFSSSSAEHEYSNNSSFACRKEAIGKLLSYGQQNLLLLSHIQGIVVAEDHQKKFLHFMFDGGQGFLSNAPMWEGG